MGPCHEKHLCEKLSALWEAGLGQVEGDAGGKAAVRVDLVQGKETKKQSEAEESRTVGVC